MTLGDLTRQPKITEYVTPLDLIKGYQNFKSDDILYRSNLSKYDENFQAMEYHFLVKSGNNYYNVEVDIDNKKNIAYVDCKCRDFLLHNSCPHLGAVICYNLNLLFGSHNQVLDNIYENILNTFYEEPKTIIKKEVKVSLNISLVNNDDYYYYYRSFIEPKMTLGVNKMYVLGNKLNNFLEVMESGEGTVKFGKEFIYDPNIHFFSPEAELLLNAYLDYTQNSQISKVKATKRLFKELKNSSFNIDNYAISKIEESFPINSFLTKNKDDYQLNFDLDNIKLIIKNDYEYILFQGKMYHLNNKEQSLLENLVDNDLNSIIIKKDNFNKFTKGLLPVLKRNIQVEDNIDLVIPSDIVKQIYFDLQNNFIKAKIKFKYDTTEIDYFDNNSSILRDMDEENKVVNDLLKYGFEINNKELILTDIDLQVDFLENGLEQLASKYVIYTTENFKSTNIRKKTNITSMFRIGQDNIFKFDFDLDGINSNELVNIFKEIKNKKKYYRLKNGDILSLEDEGIKELENLTEDLELTDEDIKKGKGSILKYRAIYLDSLKANKYNIIKTDNLFTNFIEQFYAFKDSELSLDQEDLKILRDYQVTGVKWLYNLAKTGFGGILADEMGLGKTIQVIYYLKQILQENPQAKFLIVVPTSLAYNWEHEFILYGANISRLICVGNKSKRIQLLNELKDNNVIITTYGLLREDEDLYTDLNFHTMIIDEAQNIKNPIAGITKCVKKIKAETKFALTGTPLENSVLELWSIFDFIMPGYLASLTKFQSKYKIKDFNEDSDILIKGLNKQINPFILRRKKEDVTKELPEKLINDIYIDLAEKQKTIYVAELEKVQKAVEEIMATEGVNKARFMILQLLMKLRQICIDPSIIYENYDGESNKIETLKSIVLEYIQNKHKILIFSSFRTALNIVKENLEKVDIKTYMIDGSVSSLNRIKMVDDFNNNDEVKVFLIMLKSGGTGLNLTAADVVIHLDLWWNPQAENQATDRAHRLGQTKTVEVIHLVTKGTIEEKILDLQNKKRLLADKIIDGEVRDKNILSELTKEDIENLLAYENKD